MEYRTCAVLLMRDDSTRRVYRLHDFTKSQTPTPGQYYCVSGKVNSADKLYLVIESIKLDMYLISGRWIPPGCNPI